MIEYNTTLNNLSGFALVQKKTQLTRTTTSERRLSLAVSGKLHELDPICPACRSTRVVHNGNDKCKSKFIKELGLTIKRGKFKCKLCPKTWTTEFENTELFIKQYKNLIWTTVFQLCSFGLSLHSVKNYIHNTFGKRISHEWVRHLYIKAASKIRKKKILKTSGIFHFDLQHLKINRKEFYRCVVIDAVTKDVIFDETVDDTKLETLKDELNLRLLPYNKEAFIIDLALGYPEMLKDLFPGVKIQWCIFHLNKLIVEKDFAEAKKITCYGKKKILPLHQLYNQYQLLNPFCNHDVELQFLKRLLKKAERVKQMIEGCISQKIDTTIIRPYEMKLIAEFNEFRRGLKKFRRKKIKYLLKRTREETENILSKLEKEIAFFPKKAQNRIKKIRKELEKFTLFQTNPLVPPTNNTIEQYYSATLQKTEKKSSRALDALQRKLKISRERWNRTMPKINFNFYSFLKLFAKIVTIFAPT